jgi:hypothetical protein
MNNGKNNDKNPKHNPSKAMDSKKDVEQSPDAKTDQDFPGYPHYPAKEDIMDKRTESHRVDADVENFPTSANRTGVSQRFLAGQNPPEEAATTGFGANDQLDVTDSEEEEIGKPQNVSNEELDERSRVLDDIEMQDDDSNR